MSKDAKDAKGKGGGGAEAPAPAADAAAAPKKKGGVKTIGMIVGIMVVEAVAVYMLVGGGSPKASEAAVADAHLEADPHEVFEEILIAEDKFQNMQTGQVWLWDVSVYVQVKAKNSERVHEILDQRAAEVEEGISQIISRAQLSQLKEPERQTLNRQFSAYLQKVLGSDAEEKQLFERVLIPHCRGFKADF